MSEPDGGCSQSVVAGYQRRCAALEKDRDYYQRRDRRLSNGRGLLFLIGVISLIVGWSNGGWSNPWLWCAAVAAAAFAGLVWSHERLRWQMRFVTEKLSVNRQAVARMARRWEELPRREIELTGDDASLARDLDLFGRASLFQLIGAVFTPAGIDALREWLLRPAPRDMVVRRQAAIAELAPQLDFRQDLQVLGRFLEADKADVRRFVEWAQDEPYLARHPLVAWAARGLSALTLLVVVLLLAGRLTLPHLLLMGLINLLFTFTTFRSVHAIFNRVSSRQGQVRHFHDLFARMAGMSAGSPLLASLHQNVSGSLPAAASLRRLARIVELADLRFSMGYLFVQPLTLWDFHVLAAVERWQRRCGPAVGRWFDALGTTEALAALATFPHDHPDWCFPRIEPEQSTIVATQAGHPLLSDAARVTNDFQVGPPGSLLLVTGSNMSGKSTLLRSIGLNCVLAQAGTVVCAKEWRMPSVVLGTSMRVDESLADGVSFYMAELHRLKKVVDLARRYAHDGQYRLVYLLDEILRGTNSAERQIAVRQVLLHLLRHQAIGAVSTHDLELAHCEPLASDCVPIHFREAFTTEQGVRKMTFDYKLRTGLATTTNALALLEWVGLDTAEDSTTDTPGRGQSATSVDTQNPQMH